MPHLQATHGHIVDLRRHTNVHLYWRGRYGPAERYELWLRDSAGCEHQFTKHALDALRCGLPVVATLHGDRPVHIPTGVRTKNGLKG